ncbi:MAG: glutathione S-transferase family protein [Deltaproteobacteria bacterium]|nr:MAG: glutathione S-transferase family protein [Deltaproteobacteria bacterium]
MITLYYSPGTAAMVVHWLLIELELPHTLHKLDLDAGEHKQPAYLALNPAGHVPTLVVDGVPLTEAAAIALHLADVHPARGFAPAVGSDARASYYQWMFFLANTLQPAFRAWFYPTEPAGEAHVDAVKAQARIRIEDAFTRLDAHLAAHGPYLLGDKLSTADFMLTMLMRWSRHMPRPATEWPALARLTRTMKARPSFQALYAAEGLTEWA